MKITAVTPFSVHPGWRKNWIFVKVETDAALTGWGEAYSQYDRDRPVLAPVEEIGRCLVGRDPSHIKHISQMAYHDFAIRRGTPEFYSALSGIEVEMPVAVERGAFEIAVDADLRPGIAARHPAGAAAGPGEALRQHGDDFGLDDLWRVVGAHDVFPPQIGAGEPAGR